MEPTEKIGTIKAKYLLQGPHTCLDNDTKCAK